MKEATLDQCFDLLKRVKDAGLSCEGLQIVFNSGVLSDIFDAIKLGKPIDREVVRKVLGLEPLLAVYKVIVDYSISLAEMIKAGQYGWINGDITPEHFPIKGEGSQELDITLFHFNRYIESEDAIKEMDKSGYRPATLPELLAFGASQPELQREFPIIALGSVWQGRYGSRYVPYLWFVGSKRRLSLYLFECVWGPYFRFAVARK